MIGKLRASVVQARSGLGDWRVVSGRIDASFRASSFAGAAAFINDVARAADAAGHHPDVDLRYPGHVHITLTTHAVDGLTEADVALARTISDIAATARLASEPQRALGVEVAIDALDIDAVRPFWKAVLGYDDEPPSDGDGQVVAIVDPQRIGPAFWFQQMDVARPQRNRVHIDVIVAHDVADERVAAAIVAGGHLVNGDAARAFWVLADPEGNEACVCTWQDRD